MISVFTPTHNPEFLDKAYRSLINQTWQNWEWHILCNGSKPNIVEEVESIEVGENIIREDGRVHVNFCPQFKGIGELKKVAVALTSGKIIVELDHDDKLERTALNSVHKAFMDFPEVGMVSSNYSQINRDGTPNLDRFGEVYGWGDKYKKYVDSDGLEYLEVKRFPEEHPHNYARIYSQPNHIRAFRRSVYEKVGGYDPDMVILDDQDLICRMYIEAPVYHIDELLYFQRVYEGNSQKQFTKEIPQLCEDLYCKYINDMTLAWCKRNNLLAIDLGGGHRPKEGYISLDLSNAQIIADVTNGLPFGDNTVGAIRAVDFLEHIPDKIGIINEIYRVLTEGGMLLSMTPSTDGSGAFSDPTHVAFYNERSFWYYTREAQRKFVPQIKAKFQESYLHTEDTSQIYGEGVKHVVANLIAIKEPGRNYQGILRV